MSSFDEHEDFEAAVPLSRRAMVARPASYLDDLNPAQRAAVESLDGPVLMLAGAGTGKTKALTARIVHLLKTGRARPNEILAVTFTNKAAREMKERVGRMLGETVEGMPWMGTFHAISVKILRRHAELAGLKSNFTILDTDDQLRLLRQLISAADIDEKRWPARMLAGLIDGWKNRALTPARVPSAEAGAYNNRGTELYAQYQDRLRTLNAVDFGDLLLHVVTIFQAHPDVLAQYQRWFRYILVDEYQDTNVAQYLWLRLLAQSHHNICCVGDDDQSIYGWRGAEVGNILRFETDFPGAKVIRLEQNYRSTPHILAAASGIIAANSDRLGKTLWTRAQGGEKVRLIGHWDAEEEARWIGEEVDALAKGRRMPEPKSLDKIAILVRASHQMRAFEDRFLTIGLPYRVIGGPRFYERQEVRDAMAYFRLAVSPDDDLAFERVVNTPKRGLGDRAQQSIQVLARANGLSLHEAARMLLAEGGLAGKGAGQLRAFVQGIDRWHAATRQPGCSHIELAEQILDESGYTGMWQNDKTPEAPGRLENLKELVKALEGFENLQGFLEHVALIMDNSSEDAAEKVSIMTLHAAKGLEFPVVFLPGWEDGLFPSQRSMDESGKKGLEEERRLAYVGLTRAEELAIISFASNRRVYGQWQGALPSRFIDELPEAHVEVLTPPGLYGGGYGAAGMASSIETRAMKADVYNSPGWKRMQDRAANRPVSQPRETRELVINATALSSFATGDRAFHDKFGYGTVVGIEGDKLDIAFDKAGIKKIVARFVRSAQAADDAPF
ncbi:MAG: UvrD-helicase domain-containing protein [Rhodobacter sp.]|nr:UvrD-helicase domain-containing protein [Rhodobacter sp.]MCA3514047.1 UvrD-helicase domain-containing protein [Rhodobacter sp.]MCA3518950.1 UvrD-helicase domain-containing protein [Rhodobacter sp.]MCA3523193.1 UvrD-helicase domain-containing protein [Rhodobacter sp.]MCA3525764.1 UvrD-helicase domain-containing protein [Rhodobacter sp.]